MPTLMPVAGFNMVLRCELVTYRSFGVLLVLKKVEGTKFPTLGQARYGQLSFFCMVDGDTAI